jgi:hypothetical protein
LNSFGRGVTQSPDSIFSRPILAWRPSLGRKFAIFEIAEPDRGENDEQLRRTSENGWTVAAIGQHFFVSKHDAPEQS